MPVNYGIIPGQKATAEQEAHMERMRVVAQENKKRTKKLTEIKDGISYTKHF